MNANHVYRIIWSEVHDAWIVVSEITRTHGKRKPLCLALTLVLLSANALAAGTPTTVVPTGGTTTSYYSASGVPVVNITAANSAGLSHNHYTRYDVDSKGLVLNNGNLSQIERPSQLAGRVLANPNLAREARVILNEVVSTNRSTLAGFTEVVGSKADVVVANPNGITCSGCGFINTDRATLTTGTPQINASGSLTGFAVDRGDILINGNGLNASGQQILDLVARSVKVDAPVNAAGSLQLAAGANTWSYDTRSVTGSTAPSGPVPAFAIDSSILGGMYAGRINLIGTEAGVGVRMWGNAAATADDFRIDSAGQIEIQARLAAKRDMSVAATNGDVSNAGLLLANENLDVTSSGSIVNTDTGAMAALDRLTMTATAGDISNAGLFFSGSQLNASTTSGTLTNSASGEIRSGGAMTLLANRSINNNLIEAMQDIAINTTMSFRNEIAGGMPLKNLSETSTRTDWLITEWGTACWACNYAWFREENQTITESWAGPAPAIGQMPQILAGNDLTITYGNGNARNTGGLLFATNNLTLSGSSAGAFTNESIALNTRQYKRMWYEYKDDCWDCTYAHYYYVYARSDSELASLPYFDGDHSSIKNAWYGWVYEGTVPAYRTSPSSELDERARQSAHRQITGTMETQLVKQAFVAGRTVTLSGGMLNNDSGLVASGTRPDVPSIPSSLPSNQNGFFIPTNNSSARYLIETNPLFACGSSFAGSDYLIEWLGMNPETTMKRLGDANYEAYLVRQQIVSQTGSKILGGYNDEASQMKQLMEQAASESTTLGLTFGQAPTENQIAGLAHDIIWMVETEVGGQKVLAPVVYLAAETRKSILSGAVIVGQDVNINVTAVNNTGGTISGAHALDITAQGDISNTGGRIQGGDVSLKSVEGNIVHKRSEGLGAQSAYKAAGIEATGSLAMEAKKDITVLGAEVKAGGSASLTAGDNITVDTVVDKITTISRTDGSVGLFSQTGPTTTTTTTEKNVGSTVDIGDTLTLKSGGDTTLAGTRSNVGGDLKADSKGDFNILSRQDKTTTHSESTTTGIGVGGGLWGTEKTTVDDFTGKNFGSTINVGGKADIDAAGNMTLRGSSLDIGKSATIDARSLKIEQGLDEKHTVTRTDTTTFLSTGSNKSTGAAAGASAASGNAAASTNASASANAGESSELNLMEKRTTTVDHTKTTGVASRLTTGDDLSIKTGDSVTVRGSNVEAGKALTIDAKRIDILAGENNDKTTTTTETSKIGIYTDSKAEAKAEAGASATGMSASAKAGGSVEANADSTVTIGTRLESNTDTTASLTHTSSSLKSGTEMSLKASEEARFVGAKIQSGGNLNIDAKDITNLAAEDKTTTTSDKTTRTAGIYLEGNASAEAKGSVNAGPGNNSATGGVSVSAEASAGLHYNQKAENSEQGTTHNVVSSFESGGSIVRTAKGTITDQGTQLDARQDITQSATTLKEIAVDDKTWSSSSTETHDAKIGVYAGGSFSGDAGAQTSVVSTGKYAEDLGGEASAGLQAKYSYDKASQGKSDTTAVTTRYKAGGSISSTTTEKTSLIGTQFEAGKDVTLSAGSLDYQAARDTSSAWSESRSISAEGKAKLTGTVGAEASGSYEQGKSSSSASTARAGGISAGGNVAITTQEDARFEGTAIASDGKAKLESTAGNVTFDAAKSTSHEESSGFNVSAGFGSTKQPGKEAGKDAGNEHETKTTLGGGYSTSKSDSATEAGARITARSVEISSGKDATLHGTQIEAGENASVKAQGDVKLLEATSSSSSSSFGVSGNATSMNLTTPDGENKKAQYGSSNVNVANEERNTGTSTRIKSGSDLAVKGANIITQQAGYSAGGNLVTEGTAKTQDLTNVNKGMKLDANISFVHKNVSKAKGKDDKPSAKAASKSDAIKVVSKPKKTPRRNVQAPGKSEGQASAKLP